MLRKDFEADRNDIETLKGVNARVRAEWTKDNCRVAVKRFWRWLKELRPAAGLSNAREKNP